MKVGELFFGLLLFAGLFLVMYPLDVLNSIDVTVVGLGYVLTIISTYVLTKHYD